jgi:hypothetical protein
MPRDPMLEAKVTRDLTGLADLRAQPMFGGLAWIWRGNLLCAARTDGILFRLGKAGGAAALAEAHVNPMMMGDRPMAGWVRLSPEGCGDAGARLRLMGAAKAFAETLPAK